MNHERLVIFDYSGTLSRGAVLFAREESLMTHLKESGLFNLGIGSTDMFWRDIVNVTWDEGSTTSTGYTNLIVRRLGEIFPGGAALSPSRMESAASRFVHAYFDHSAPDPPWKPLLSKLAADPRTCLVIATDHYAEATGYIIKHMNVMNIPASSARAHPTEDAVGCAIVANSADMGFQKADRCFWEGIKSEIPVHDIRRVLMVDDFGYNEMEGDSYGAADKVAARKDTTKLILSEVFPGDITVLPFLIPREKERTLADDRHRNACNDLIVSTIRKVDRWLAGT